MNTSPHLTSFSFVRNLTLVELEKEGNSLHLVLESVVLQTGLDRIAVAFQKRQRGLGHELASRHLQCIDELFGGRKLIFFLQAVHRFFAPFRTDEFLQGVVFSLQFLDRSLQSQSEILLALPALLGMITVTLTEEFP